MFSIRFQTILVIITTAVVTIFAYDLVREKTEEFMAARQLAKKPAAAPVSGSITITLPVLETTTVNTVVGVPDGGTILIGGIKRQRRLPLLNPPASNE